jgi:hypothetical protein
MMVQCETLVEGFEEYQEVEEASAAMETGTAIRVRR